MEDDARTIVEREMSHRLSRFDTLPEDLRDLVERHCGTLIGLMEAMRQAGKDPDEVHSMFAALISTYDAGLVRAMKDRR